MTFDNQSTSTTSRLDEISRDKPRRDVQKSKVSCPTSWSRKPLYDKNTVSFSSSSVFKLPRISKTVFHHIKRRITDFVHRIVQIKVTSLVHIRKVSTPETFNVL